MLYLSILDYTNGTVIVIPDPKVEDYDEFITETYGHIEYYFMLGHHLKIEV